MICYNCGHVLTNSDYCGNCGIDVSVYKRIVKLSNTYYNVGLTKAKNRDLSGAADILRRSIKLNKRNIDARNLLGLVYFEMGETVQAFSEWVMSTNIQPDNNPASRYLVDIQQEQGKIDELNHSIKKFNVALDYAKEGTYDMAVIQLKKVLNQNPNLIKAYQLLGLLYIKDGQYERAKRTLKKALKIDKCNPLCNEYIREVDSYLENEKKNDPEKGVERRRLLRGTDHDRPYLSGNDTIIPQNNFAGASMGARGILQVIAGLLIGAALVYFIVTPARLSAMTDKLSDVSVDYDQKLAVKNSTISELEDQVDTLTNENENIQSQLSQYTDTDNTIASNYSYLLEAVQHYLDEDYDACAKSVEKVDDDLKMDSKAFDSVYSNLSSRMASKVAENAFDSGMSAYGSEDYAKAVTEFKKAYDANKNNDEALYYLAYAYERNGDNENALKYFKKLANDFPSSQFAEQAENKVEALGGE